MRVRLACAVLLASPLAALAHGNHHHNVAMHKRQSGSVSHTEAPTTTRPTTSNHPPSTTPSPTTSSRPTPDPTVSQSSSVSRPVITGGASASDAMPIESIVPQSVVANQPAVPLPATAQGAKPSGLPNAPALPNPSSFNPSKYPPSDKEPPTNSPEVIEWIRQVRNSGVVIPNIAPIVHGDAMCQIPANAGRVNNATECWWTCGHCERKTDIVNCRRRNTWGSSFDDGPAPDTPKLLQYLEREEMKTTFFVIGSRVKDRPQILRTAYVLGHTIGTHGWSHTAMTTQTTEALIAELGWSKQIIKDATGVTPRYFRPPYGDINDRVRAIAYAMDLVPVIWTVGNGFAFDSFDWVSLLLLLYSCMLIGNSQAVPSGMETAVNSVNQFLTILSHAKGLPNGFIVLEHDLFWQQVELAVGYFLPSARAEHFTVTSINECNDQSLASMYVETAGANAPLPAGSGSGSDMTGWGQVAPANAPLGGSDGSNANPTVLAGQGKPTAKPTTSVQDIDDNDGRDSAHSLFRMGEAIQVVGAVALAAMVAGAAAL